MAKTVQDYIDELKAFSLRSKFRDTDVMSASVPTIAQIAENQEKVGSEDTGFLTVLVTHSRGTFPVNGARVDVFNKNGDLILTEFTDMSGRTRTMALPTQPGINSENPNTTQEGVSDYYDIEISAPNFVKARINNIPIFEGVNSLQGFDMVFVGAAPSTEMQVIDLPVTTKE